MRTIGQNMTAADLAASKAKSHLAQRARAYVAA